MITKTKTKPLSARNYISDAGQLSLAKLTDDALAALDRISANGVGRQRGRSRGVIYRSFKAIAIKGGYDESQAHKLWRNQVLPLEALAINAGVEA
jgi:hypothetical protein